VVNKTEKDRWSAVVWMAVAIGICFGSIKLSLGELHRPGPGLFSFLAGSILGIFSLNVFLGTLKRTVQEERKAFWGNLQRGLKMTYVFIALFLYAIGMNYLGFFFSTLLFLGFLLKKIDPQPWSVVLSVSLFGTVIFYLIFKYWLAVPFPKGLLGF
jgi:putative tricarboxylic transport membrane protein